MEENALLDAIDAVYAVALDRFRWPDALGAVASRLGAGVAMLLAPHGNNHHWHIVAASGLPEALVDAYNTHWSSHDPFVAERPAGPSGPPVVRTLHVDQHRGPFTNFFCEPAGCRSGLMAAGAEQDALAVAFWRPGDRRFGERETAFLRTLWPHIARARRIQETQWSAAVTRPATSSEAVLDLWPIGVITFSPEGRQLYANQAARQIAADADGLSLAVDGPLAAIPRETRLLREAIRQVGEGGGPDWLRLPRPSGARAYEVALCRTRFGQGDLAIMMFIAEPDTPINLDAGALRRLHGLTELEVRIAECVVRGLHVAEIASSLNLTQQTTRWYVQQVRQKLEASSQSEIVRVLIRGVSALSIQSGPQGRQKN